MPLETEGDAFGQIYEYFMGNFVIETMQKGGEFYTPITESSSNIHRLFPDMNLLAAA